MDTVAFSKEIRRQTLRCINSLGSGHVGGSLSIADVLAVLYCNHMNVDPKNPHKEGRDKLVLSKGHSGPALYATLAIKGFFPIEQLLTLNQMGTELPSHCNMVLTKGVDMTAGSLGQGLSCACGLALAMKLKQQQSYVYVITGDGELQEGQNWEGAMFAAGKKLDNIIVFVDNNGLQIDGATDDIIKVEDLSAKWSAFGFATQRVNGHDHDAIDKAIRKAKKQKGVPHCIILDTVKGKGVSFYEQMGAGVHSTNVTAEQLEKALVELQ